MIRASRSLPRRGMPARLVACVILLHLAILAAEWTSPHDPTQQYRASANAPPDGTFPLGTDDLGRDRLSRLIHGARVSLVAAGLATALALVLGLVLGLIAGAGGDVLDRGVTVLGEVVVAVPWIFLLLAIRSAVPLDIAPLQAFLLLASLLGGLNWVPAARAVRASIRHTLAQEYVLASESAGAGRRRLVTTHALPDALRLLGAHALILLPQFVLAETALSFVGLGLPEPLPTFGALLADLRTIGSAGSAGNELWTLAPAVALAGLVAMYSTMANRMAR